MLNDNLAFPPDTLVTSYVRTGKKDSSGQDEYIVDAAAQIEADHENSPKVDRISRIMKLYNASTMNESHRFYRAGIHSDTLREPKRGLSRLADKLAVLKYRFALRYQLIRKDAADHKIAEHMELLDTYWLLREVTGYCLPHFLLQSQLSRSFYSNDNNFRNTVIAAI